MSSTTMGNLEKRVEELMKGVAEVVVDSKITPPEKNVLEAALTSCNNLLKAIMTLQGAAQESNELRADHTKLLNDMLKRKTDLCKELTMIRLKIEKFEAAAVDVIYKYGTDIVAPLVMKIAALDAEIEGKARKSSLDLSFSCVEKSLEDLGIEEAGSDETNI